MKKISLLIVLLLAIINGFAQVKSSLVNSNELESFNIDANNGNEFKLGDINIGLILLDKSWGQYKEKEKFSPDDGYPKIDAKTFFSKGNFFIYGTKTCRYEKIAKLNDDGWIDVAYKISGINSQDVNVMSVTVHIPFPHYAENTYVDSKKVPFPKEYVKGKYSYPQGKFKKMKFVGVKGVAELSADSLDAHIQDDREWNQKEAIARIGMVKQQNGDYIIKFSIKYTPYTFSILNFNTNCNLNVGNLPVGEKTFGEIKYKIDSNLKGLEILPTSEVYINTKNPNENVFYILNAFEAKNPMRGDLAKITAIYEDGSQKSAYLDSDWSNNFSNEAKYAVWRSIPNSVTMRKLYSSRVELPQGKIKTLILKNVSDALWKIAAITSSTGVIPETSMICKYIAEDENYKPFTPKFFIKEGSALDFSFLLDAPAGKYGFAKAVGDTIGFEKKPNAKLRLFGTNICMRANFPTKENAIKLADYIARSGYNSVRFHHFDPHIVDMNSPEGIDLKADMMDKFDFLLSEMKKRGIYVTIDVYMSRRLKKSVPEPEFNYDPNDTWDTEMKALFVLSENSMRNLEKYTENLFNHVNPYTGLAWKDEPAIVSVSLLNEANIKTIFFSKQRPRFEKLFEKWLADRNITTKGYKDRQVHFMHFCKEIYDPIYARLSKHLRSLGVKAMLTDLNNRDGVDVSLGSTDFDIIDTHFYYGHPHFIEEKWKLPAKVLSNSALGANNKGGPNKGALRIAGKPFYMTEWSHVASNKNAAEGGFIMGAYMGLQGWDGIYRFCYSHRQTEFNPATMGFFDSDTNPILALSDRAVSSFFLRRDVKQSDIIIPYLVSKDIWKRSGEYNYMVFAENATIPSVLALIARPETFIYDTPKNVDLPKNAKFAVASDEAWLDKVNGKKVFKGWEDSQVQEAAKLLGADISNGVYKSSTGQIELDTKNETFSVSTKRSEGYIGKEGAKVDGKFGSLACTSSRSCVLVSALENRSLEKAKRILILHLTDIKNSNLKYKDLQETILLENGQMPLLLSVSKAKLYLNRDFSGFKLYALDDTGQRIGEIPMKTGSVTEIELNTDTPFGAVMAYELFIVP